MLVGFPQVMSLLPQTPTSRGLRPRTAALRLSLLGAGFARLPRLDCTAQSGFTFTSNQVSTEMGEGQRAR